MILDSYLRRSSSVSRGATPVGRGGPHQPSPEPATPNPYVSTDGAWAADQRQMEDVRGEVYITADAIRAAMKADELAIKSWTDLNLPGQAPTPTSALHKIVDMQLADLRRALLTECIANWALERGLKEECSNDRRLDRLLRHLRTDDLLHAHRHRGDPVRMIERWGRWLDEGMERSPWLGMGRLTISATLAVAVISAIVHFALALIGVNVGYV